MAALNPPFSTAVVNVPDESAEKYKAQGWRVVERKTAAPVSEKSERRGSRRS